MDPAFGHSRQISKLSSSRKRPLRNFRGVEKVRALCTLDHSHGGKSGTPFRAIRRLVQEVTETGRRKRAVNRNFQ